ncbi:MAG TPA: class IV adenylate cyclase [Candidatus Thermoplasmatota archaeon]|nr:class IV adenylate cyclase [Candidatus Thermoplasmatota archaeon]
MLEFRMKAVLSQEEVPEVQRQLEALRGVQPLKPMTDHYYVHSSKPFTPGEEALRIRVTPQGSVITHRGGLKDPESKSQLETTLKVSGGQAHDFLVALGFNQIKQVVKQRRTYVLNGFELHLDHVEGLGWFLQAVRSVNKQADMPLAKLEAQRLFKRFNLAKFEPRSYLELLLENNGAGATAG